MKREEILERVDFAAFFQSQIEGYRPSPSGQATGRCPFHEDTHESFSVDTRRGLWNCKAAGCGVKGDFFDFYGRLTGIDPRQDFRGLLDRIAQDLGLGSMPEPERVRIVKRKTSGKISVVSDPIAEAINDQLRKDLTPDLLAHLATLRGISEQTLRAFEIGWDAPRHRYTIPVRDGRGLIRNIRLYSSEYQPKILNWFHWECDECGAISRRPQKTMEGKDAVYWCPACKKKLASEAYKTFGGVRLYPLDHFLKVDPGEVVVCEGEWDSLVLWDHGVPALTGTGGAGTWRADWNRVFQGRRVAFTFDADEAGREASRRHAHALLAAQTAAAVKVVDLPLPGTKVEKDITDWFKTGRTLAALLGSIKASAPIDAEIITPPAQPPAPPPTTSRDVPADDSQPDLYDAGNMFVNDHPFACKDGEVIIRYWRSSWYRWDGHCYKELMNGDVEAKITQFIQYAYGGCFRKKSISTVVRDVGKVIQSRVNIESKFNPPVVFDPNEERAKEMNDLVVFKNGVLDVRQALAGNHTLIKHDPKLFILHSLPFAYDPAAQCPLWMDTLSYFWPDADVRQSLREFVGLTLIADVDYQLFLLLFGEGENGKSTFLETVEALLGAENYASLDLTQLGDRFGPGQLIGKLANLCGDLRDTDERGEVILKAIVGGDKVQCERKFKDGLSVSLPTRFYFASNTMPHFSDKSHGFWRKILPIPCKVRITKEKKDPKWKEKIKAAELPGIFNWAIQGLTSLRQRGGILIPAEAEDLKEIARESLNPARKFLKDEVKYVEAARLRCAMLYQKYATWARDNGFKPLAETNFGAEVLRLFEGKVERVRQRDQGARAYYYTNLADQSESDF